MQQYVLFWKKIYLFSILWNILKRRFKKRSFIRNKNALVVIYEIKVTKKQYNKIKDKIKEIELNNKGYNIIGLLLAHFRVKLHRRKYYCSEFVYEVLSNKEIEIYNKENTLFKPEELITNNRFVKIFEGKIRDYIAIC